jgi:signal transduction histidine kinase
VMMVSSGPTRLVEWARRHPDTVDIVVALAAAAFALLAAHIVFDEVQRNDPTFSRPSGVAVAVAMLSVTLPLAVRRRLPLLTALVVSVAFVVGRQVLDVSEPVVSVLAVYFALYSAARHGRRPWRTPALLVASAVVMGEVVDEALFADGIDPGPVAWFLLVYNAVSLAAPWWLGSTMRVRHQREQELIAQTVELEREREDNARRAVFEERVRVARELHDVVAHHVSVMGIQAGAARRVLDRRPDAAAEALVAIETASRQAVAEMDRLLGFLRRDGETDPRTPQPGISDLDGLVADVGRAGLAVELTVADLPPDVPRTVEVSAYRIVQEALTNTLKHSGSARASVRVRVRADALEVDVDDDGSPTVPAEADAGGHGLIGMRERVGLHGGQLRAGPRPDGGFAVRAQLPLGRST